MDVRWLRGLPLACDRLQVPARVWHTRLAGGCRYPVSRSGIRGRSVGPTALSDHAGLIVGYPSSPEPLIAHATQAAQLASRFSLRVLGLHTYPQMTQG